MTPEKLEAARNLCQFGIYLTTLWYVLFILFAVLADKKPKRTLEIVNRCPHGLILFALVNLVVTLFDTTQYDSDVITAGVWLIVGMTCYVFTGYIIAFAPTLNETRPKTNDRPINTAEETE